MQLPTTNPPSPETAARLLLASSDESFIPANSLELALPSREIIHANMSVLARLFQHTSVQERHAEENEDFIHLSRNNSSSDSELESYEQIDSTDILTTH